MKKFFAFVAAVVFAGSMMAATSMTCAEAAAAALSVSGNNVEYNNGEEIEVVGYVTNIAYSWASGTMTFWMADDSLETANVLEAYKCAIANEADAPKVTDKVKVTGKLTKYNTTPEFKEGCTCEILQVGKGKEEVVIEVSNCATAAEAALSVSGNNALYNNGAEYTVQGYVTSIQNAWNNGVMTFWMADTQDGGNVLEAYKCAIANQADAPNVGDKVAVTGKLTKYNTTPEFAEGCTCVVLERGDAPKNLGVKTIAEFLSLKNKKDTCILHGTIANLPEDKTVNAWLYGNFDLVDATGSVYIYGLLTPDGQSKQFASMGLENGSEITVKAIYTEYNNNPQVANAILVEEEVVEDADVVFTSTEFNGQGTSGTGSEVTATKDGVTFTCDKAYGDQYGVRCYKNSKVTISSTDQQIGKIVFEFATVGTTYYNGDLPDEIVVNGMEWKVEGLASQARMNKIKIYFGEYEPIVIEMDTINVADAVNIALALDNNVSTTEDYAVVGYLAKYANSGEYNAQFGNVSFYMTDDATSTYGDLSIYHAKISEAEGTSLAAGDRVMVVGKLTNNYYNDKNTAQIKDGKATVEWKSAIENILKNDTKINKVIVDGVVYIVRDGKMFTVQGVEIR